jgi:cation diffusion facilitator family transporter
LVVLLLVVATKELLARRIESVGTAVGSVAVRADALHHRSDALTSAAAAIGITISIVGGEGWAVADDWAALAASAIIAWNGLGVLRPALADLMDRSPASAVGARIEEVARLVPDVRGIEKVRLRPSGLGVYVELHVEADPAMTLQAAHALGGLVRSTLRREVPEVLDVLVHMEPARAEVVLDNVGADERPR